MNLLIFHSFKNALQHPEQDHGEFIKALDDASGPRGLEIYQHAYKSRLRESLQNDYPQLYQYLGDDLFSLFAGKYIDNYPSRFFSLRDFGKFLPEYLQHEASAKSKPYLAELAQFEFLLTAAFDAADDPVLSKQQLTEVEPQRWPQLCFRLHPSVKFFDYQWNVLPIWKSLKEEREPPKPERLNNPGHCLIWRVDFRCHHKTMEDQEYLTLEALHRGASFETMCAQLQPHAGDQAALTMATYLGAWVNSGLILNQLSFCDNDALE